ncbi:hypothetical protein [Nonomuraea basaltis]|uniref:hypothetical protein n=1 Tax=Nonomuraea basaltis TaxID=2495887 RepID=UPI00110C589C|nr:hypothetical protein [Nonomuraea basaltis]TMR97548.1 hypothetical protein EJK15_17665 [Nonomuraea basaltis]
MARAGRGYPNRAVQVRTRRGESLPILFETDQALPFGIARARTAVRAGESGAARPLTAVKIQTIAQVVDIEQVPPLQPAKVGVLLRVVASDAALQLGRRKTRLAGLAAEVDTAAVMRSKAQVSRVAELDHARPFRAVKIRSLARAQDSGQSRLVTFARAVQLSRANAADVALAVSATKRRVLGRAVETGTARVVLRRTPPLRAGKPFVAWTTSPPYTTWARSSPHTRWSAARPTTQP